MRRSARNILFVLASLVAASCTGSATARYVKEQENLVFRGIDQEAIAKYSPPSKLFRIAVIDFVDQTHNTAGKVEDMFADVMTTALYRTNRFTLYDRSQLKRKNRETPNNNSQNQQAPVVQVVTSGGQAVPAASQQQSQQQSQQTSEQGGRYNDSDQAERQMNDLSREVDGVFTAFITNAEMSEGHGTYTIDYRIVKRVLDQSGNPATLVIFADSASVHFNGNPMQKESKPITLNRSDLESIAGKVADFFPRLHAAEYASGRVTDINGRTVTISLGSKLVKAGYSFFVTTEPDEATGEFDYKGNFVVRDAFDKASRADLVSPVNHDGTPDDRYMRTIKVGDRILMK